MSREYTPDNWVIIKLQGENPEEHHFRVAASWFGGYTYGASWKFSSGIETISDRGDFYEVKNASGSIYNCFKHSQRPSGYLSSVIQSYLDEGAKITIVDISECKNFVI